jgi:predicted transcriptional regulator
LDALLAFEAIGLDKITRQGLAPTVNNSHTSGSFKNNLSRLRILGLIDYAPGNQVFLSDTGKSRARNTITISSRNDLHDAMLGILTNPQKSILRVLIDVWPKEIPRERLAESVHNQATSGSFKNNLSRLRTLKALEYLPDAHVRASDLLFPDGLR